jgi:hypothetical protein
VVTDTAIQLIFIAAVAVAVQALLVQVHSLLMAQEGQDCNPP